MQCLNRVRSDVERASDSDMVLLLDMCCSLQGLTSLSCAADAHVEEEGSSWDGLAIFREQLLQLELLSGLQHLALGGFWGGCAFQESLQYALRALQQLQSLELERIAAPSEEPGAAIQAAGVHLAGIYECFPATLSQLRLAEVPVTESLATRLPSLTQLRRLLLCDCGMRAAALNMVATATSRMPVLDEVKMADPNLRTMTLAELMAAMRPSGLQMNHEVVTPADEGHERDLLQLARREDMCSLFLRAYDEEWTVVRWHRRR